MPVPSPFHPRTAALCESLLWKEWAGYHAVRAYDTAFEREYQAFRHSAGLLDVTPLFKYEVRGRDAGAFLAWVSVKDPRRLADGQVTYLCWCDERGGVLDDGTITRFGEERYRMTSADPSFAWLERHTDGFEVTIEDVSEALGALALQGPRSRDVLVAATGGALADLGFFRAGAARIAGVPVDVTRTGYTGDLGYEIWCPANRALDVWDALVDAGAPHRLLPAGLDALDVTRVEAGFILAGVDYTSARRALIDEQRSSPFEIGLGWTVKLEREPFLSQRALIRERERKGGKRLVGLEIDWDELEALYDAKDLPPALDAHAWRSSIPLYDGGAQVGYATSGAWSPTLKKNLALATVLARYEPLGTRLEMEWTVEHERHRVGAVVVRRPFFDPPRKRASGDPPRKRGSGDPPRERSSAT